ncbi:uncharacterized protein PV09_03331 [Verruconis gallopava]|uniref:Ornithine decarboxylase antizyme n=1 Tax=Verruconis gallopava TaxID=253628 RepID=A0A0D1YXL1_9PEZI|nr:uncharacterized protein PV09_03331 [Verruconis gallopava]KIW05442.1 hypothetical protein PV09_03331 [Verruconis gallopava]
MTVWPLRASITLPGLAGSGGIPEVHSGTSSPDRSPPLTATVVNVKHSGSKNVCAKREGAAFTIAEECERLFCETLKTIFLGDGGMVSQDSLAMGTHSDSWFDQTNIISNLAVQPVPTNISPYSAALAPVYASSRRSLTDWLEMYDYVGGSRFRGCIVEGVKGRSMFIFFEASILDSDLKPGLMALLELCSVPEAECSKLVVCVDRGFESQFSQRLLRDLGWVGFEPITLDEWSGSSGVTSDRWMFLSMEV